MSPMRVAVDVTSLLDARTGVGRFTAAVVDRLAERDDVDLSGFSVSFRGRHRLAAAVPAGLPVSGRPGMKKERGKHLS